MTTTGIEALDGALAALGEAFDKVIDQIEESPAFAVLLSDNQMLAVAAWFDGADDTGVIRDECKRRHDHHSEQVDRFDAFRDQLDIIADVPGDMPWTEARAVLAARLGERVSP